MENPVPENFWKVKAIEIFVVLHQTLKVDLSICFRQNYIKQLFKLLILSLVLYLFSWANCLIVKNRIRSSMLKRKCNKNNIRYQKNLHEVDFENIFREEIEISPKTSFRSFVLHLLFNMMLLAVYVVWFSLRKTTP